MSIKKLATLAGLCAALCTPASAQFSASGPGATIPASGTGGGGIWTTVLPPSPAVSVAAVAVPVNSIDSIDITGLNHTWIGDLQMVLTDPNGIGHLIVLRPGVDFGGSTVGNGGDFLLGDYSFVESGGMDLPVDTVNTDQNPGTYNQTFSTGITTWPSGQLGISNTPMSMIAGPAGNWTLSVYDWAGLDTGLFAGWTLNGNGGGGNTGAAYCFGDGTGTNCPCSAFGGPGEGCVTTSGTGALLTGTGDANVAGDTFTLTVTGGPANKPGIFFQGPNQLMNVAAGDGVLCSNSNLRYAVNSLDSSGSVTQTGFGVNSASGTSLNYQYWFRDPGNPCNNGGFNFSNGWAVTWN